MRISSDVCVIIPAFNEGNIIAQVLSDLDSYPYRVVVVDDGSTDDTFRQALSYPVTILQHICNLGQGAALQTGISYGLQFPEIKYLVTFDADGQHSPDDIENLLRPLRSGNYDVVLGSRFMRGGAAVNIKGSRLFLLRLAITFTRLMTGLAVTDTHNGFRAFTSQAAARVNITQSGMAHASQILSRVASQKLRFCEVPVTISYTEYSMLKGQSAWNSINILWDILVGSLR